MNIDDLKDNIDNSHCFRTVDIISEGVVSPCGIYNIMYDAHLFCDDCPLDRVYCDLAIGIK